MIKITIKIINKEIDISCDYDANKYTNENKLLEKCKKLKSKIKELFHNFNILNIEIYINDNYLSCKLYDENIQVENKLKLLIDFAEKLFCEED